MKMYVVQEGAKSPQVRWTLEEAQNLIQREYAGHDLSFEEDGFTEDCWFAYDWSAMVEERAGIVPMKIFMVDAPAGPPVTEVRSLDSLPDGVAVRMEMRVTTRKGKTSFEHMDTTDIWESTSLGKGFLVQEFARRAGRSLADHLTEEST